jgi:hypothetical protein
VHGKDVLVFLHAHGFEGVAGAGEGLSLRGHFALGPGDDDVVDRVFDAHVLRRHGAHLGKGGLQGQAVVLAGDAGSAGELLGLAKEPLQAVLGELLECVEVKLTVCVSSSKPTFKGFSMACKTGSMGSGSTEKTSIKRDNSVEMLACCSEMTSSSGKTSLMGRVMAWFSEGGGKLADAGLGALGEFGAQLGGVGKVLGGDGQQALSALEVAVIGGFFLVQACYVVKPVLSCSVRAVMS